MADTQQDEPLDDTVLNLPDGTRTKRQEGDILVWHKRLGTYTMQRPGVGPLTSRRLSESRIPCDPESVRELERLLAEREPAASFLALFGFRLLDESADKVILVLDRSEALF